MNRSNAASEATWAARLTPAVPAAIATIAVRGPLAAQLLATSFRTGSGQSPAWRPGQVRFGLWTLQGSGVSPEHVVVAEVADQHFEIHCHGGLAVSDWILSDLEDSGCVICPATEWPSSRPGRIEAAAELALARAATLKVAAVLLDQFSGCLTRELRSIAAALAAPTAAPAAASGFATVRAACARLLERADFGMKLLEPRRLTLAGPPNVGKSSLTNALVGAARVLVHHEPGTTRDAVETSIVVASWPLVLTDTAGVRESVETIERQGIDAARQRWRAADVGLLVVDATVGWTPVHSELIGDRIGATLVLLNKSDLRPEVALPGEALANVAGISTANGTIKVVATDATGPAGVAGLIAALADHLDSLMPPPGAAVPFLEEHAQLVREVDKKLADGQPVQALEAITSYLASDA